MTSPELLETVESYYDAAPRPSAEVEEIGPFTLYVQRDPAGWPYYARPRLGSAGPFTPDDVATVRARQRELGLPEAFEWVHEVTPALLEPARVAGLVVHECPLLVLAGDQPPPVEPTADVQRLAPDAPDLGAVMGAIGAAFGGSDEVTPTDPSPQVRRLMSDGLLSIIGAYDGSAPVGGGSHGPRGATTELTGIGVLPRARRRGIGAAVTHALVEDARARGVETIFLSAGDDEVARVYERVGFVRVGTACIAEPADSAGH